MLRRFSVDFAVFSMGLDGVLIAITLAIATSIRPALSDLTFVAEVGPDLITPIHLYVLFPLLWVLKSERPGRH